MRTVPDLLRQAARLVPDRAAVVLDGGERLTFAQLDARSDAFARGLREHGVGPGDRVALALGGEAWPQYAVAYFGALKLGAVALLVGNRFGPDELGRIVSGYGVARVVRAGDDLGAGHPGEPLPVSVEPGDAAEVVFTSGTTDRPRGVVATHANLLRAQVAWPTAARANQPCAHALPVGSVAAQAVLLNCIGGQHTLLAAPAFTVAGFTALAAREGAVTVCLVPAMGHWLVRAAPGEATPMPSVKGVSFSGAPLPIPIMADLAAVFPNAAFHNFYTSTETYPARVATRFDPARPEAVGRPVGSSAVRVTGPDGAEVAAGETGDVWLRAGGAPPRRLLDADAQAGRPIAAGDGWTRTGDLGYVDAEGTLFLTGRAGDIVIVGGFNVATARVEQVLTRHPAVAEAAVCGADHPVLGEIVAAFVVLRRGHAEATARDLRRHAVEQLTRAEVPAVIRLVEDLPRNEAGKVVKRDLPALLDAPGAVGFVAPRTDLERGLAAVWAEVLQSGAVGAADNFFEIGGDSLAATRIAATARERLGVDVDTIAVLEAPSVAELAQYIVEREHR
ncbi:AMP-binding protein [Dactylosporangium vinaceum]|uniref:AMP-binding protein n=1 Tax=Dactylosporangium vinaceum TaxID=53362 RepID=A0ABV5M5U7_9ACTN|nr:AMP-binding protein [Dactylosporangium vinaceum]UAC01256.1 AMP-binding protein [Dactylosporangium vinaceum]